MTESKNPYALAFGKLLKVTNSEAFYVIRKSIINGRLNQCEYIESEKLYRLAEELDLRLVWTTEYLHFIQNNWLKPCYLVKGSRLILPFPITNFKSERFLKKTFFHPYRILEVANCSKKGAMTRDGLIIWWRRKKKRREAMAHVKEWENAFLGLFDPERVRALVELGIVLEPIYRPDIRGRLTLRGITNQDYHYNETERIRLQLIKLTEGLSKEDWEQIHNKANQFSNGLFKNDEVKTLITLMRNDDQDRIKGKLGAALMAREIAHLVRLLAYEHKVELVEEQFSESPGYTNAYFKHSRGSKQIIDGPRENRLKFVRGFGLDFGIRIRVYVEGATEFACFRSIVGKLGFVELVDLKGAFWQKGGKGVAFRESLRNDKRGHIYSIIVLDGDRADNIRVVKDAARSEEFLGQFFISHPDFELQNFKLSEISEIFSLELNRKVDESILLAIKSAKDLFKTVHQSIPESKGLVKGEKWGELLAKYSMKHPNSKPLGLSEDRHINQVVRFCHFSKLLNFANDAIDKKIDLDSGKMVDRDSKK